MATSGSRDFIHTRNSIIRAALRKIGVVAENQEPSPEQYSAGAETLNTLVKSLQTRGVFLWTLNNKDMALTSGKSTYDLSSDVIDIQDVFYREDGNDTYLEPITKEEYARKIDKDDSGDPSQYLLDKQITVPKLTLWRVPDKTTGVVVGTDSNNYKCIKSHTADSSNRPITGASYATYWEQTSTLSGSTWVSGTNYKSSILYFTEVLKLQDFDSTGDNPDFPVKWSLALIYGLAFHLSFDYAVPERGDLEQVFEREFALALDSDKESANLYLGIRRRS